jgi:hypothetical protein
MTVSSAEVAKPNNSHIGSAEESESPVDPVGVGLCDRHTQSCYILPPSNYHQAVDKTTVRSTTQQLVFILK